MFGFYFGFGFCRFRCVVFRGECRVCCWFRFVVGGRGFFRVWVFRVLGLVSWGFDPEFSVWFGCFGFGVFWVSWVFD